MKDELYHYGVKGMKWGVRKRRKRSPKHSLNSLANSPKLKKNTRKIKDNVLKAKKWLETNKRITGMSLSSANQAARMHQQANDLFMMNCQTINHLNNFHNSIMYM